MVRISMPNSPTARTVRRSASTPRRWPSLRGNPRAAAQRPLPSMMIATCRGTATSPWRTLGSGSAFDIAQTSHCEGFPFLRRQPLVDIRNDLVGRLLDLLGRPFAVVLADLVILFQLLDDLKAVAPHVADRHLGSLSIFMRNLHQFLAPLLVELRESQPQNLTLGRRGETEIG